LNCKRYVNAELEITKRWATVAYFKVLFSTFLQRRKITKTHQEYQFMAQDSKPAVVFFPYALRFDPSLSPSATLVVDFATKTGFTLGMLDPSHQTLWYPRYTSNGTHSLV
jgi:hypothetical protein